MAERICVVGLGYVGLPLAVQLARHFEVTGYDRDPQRIRELLQQHDRTGQTAPGECAHKNLHFTPRAADAAACTVFIITVPTPLRPDLNPDLQPLETACRDIAPLLRQGSLVIIESTVYPGVTEDICAPLLARDSGLVFNQDFTCGYSPERVSPHGGPALPDIVKITSGSTPEAAARTDAIYAAVITAGTMPVSSIRIAETAKVLENTQRDINIALMNEAAMICHSLDLDSAEVFRAAASKWNFLNFRPGLVGGHCIGVDPYYLLYKARHSGHPARLLRASRQINDAMGQYIARAALELMRKHDLDAAAASVLILGFAYKENCPDTRNSRVFDLYQGLAEAGCAMHICDPLIDPAQTRAEYPAPLNLSTDWRAALADQPDLIIFAVAHDAFQNIPESALGRALVLDVKGQAARADWRL